ncbi:STAS domain-containing protein [Candidatus Poribacteria bacterium]|nr:STAS domain-containing protein [Candidatus Poribacteria bacterium]MYG09110.1 STAS domain-containing protein [Candidatus Poribacteria bacterium]MYK22429.1 STAS domain-containing protein [Candidatus Poribacteria bacterium]
MTTTIRLAGGVPILEPKGKIIGPTGDQLKERLVSEIADAQTSCVLINFEHVYRIDSTGMGALVMVYIEVKRRGGRIGIINVGTKIRSLIVRTQLITLFQYFQDEDAAVAALSNIVNENKPYVQS